MKSKINPAVLAILTTHWAMEPTALAQLERRLLAVPPGMDVAAKYDPKNDPKTDLQSRLLAGLFDGDPDDGPKPRKPYEMAGGIAVLRLSGPLQKDPSWLMRYYGGTSTRAFIAMLALAEGDPDVGAICVVPDSPGGDVDGTVDAADAVYAVRQRGKKPIVAAVDGYCCSAAYWIASQCSKVYGGQTSVVGSIGTRWSMIDTSAAYELLGLKKVEITSGTYKAAGADGLPITAEDRAYFQGVVDDMQSRFSAGVVRGRKLSADAVRALAADAKIYVGKAALDAGLVDEIVPVRDVIRQLQKTAASRGTTALSGTSALAEELLAERTGEDMADETKNRKGFQAAFVEFMAQFSGEKPDGSGEKPEGEEGSTLRQAAAGAAEQAAPHPVLTAALAAGLDTPEKLQAILDERTARQEAEATSAAKALTTAREAAEGAALTAFGQGSAELTAAQEAIQQQDSLSALGAMTAAYQAAAPRNLRPGASRQTKPASASSTDNGTGEAETDPAQEAVAAGLTPSSVYASRRPKGRRAG